MAFAARVYQMAIYAHRTAQTHRNLSKQAENGRCDVVRVVGDQNAVQVACGGPGTLLEALTLLLLDGLVRLRRPVLNVCT